MNWARGLHVTRPPLVLGLTLCDDAVTDPATGKLSLIGAFTGLAMAAFPGVPQPFCAYAALTAGQGDARFTLELALQDNTLQKNVIRQWQGTVSFADPLQTVNWLVRLTRCLFPTPGEYLFTLWIDGEWMAQRRLRVYLRE